MRCQNGWIPNDKNRGHQGPPQGGANGLREGWVLTIRTEGRSEQWAFNPLPGLGKVLVTCLDDYRAVLYQPQIRSLNVRMQVRTKMVKMKRICDYELFSSSNDDVQTEFYSDENRWKNRPIKHKSLLDKGLRDASDKFHRNFWGMKVHRQAKLLLSSHQEVLRNMKEWNGVAHLNAKMPDGNDLVRRRGLYLDLVEEEEAIGAETADHQVDDERRQFLKQSSRFSLTQNLSPFCILSFCFLFSFPAVIPHSLAHSCTRICSWNPPFKWLSERIYLQMEVICHGQKTQKAERSINISSLSVQCPMNHRVDEIPHFWFQSWSNHWLTPPRDLSRRPPPITLRSRIHLCHSLVASFLAETSLFTCMESCPTPLDPTLLWVVWSGKQPWMPSR